MEKADRRLHLPSESDHSLSDSLNPASHQLLSSLSLRTLGLGINESLESLLDRVGRKRVGGAGGGEQVGEEGEGGEG